MDNIIENKDTDGATLKHKNDAWIRVTAEYNASPLTTKQLNNYGADVSMVAPALIVGIDNAIDSDLVEESSQSQIPDAIEIDEHYEYKDLSVRATEKHNLEMQILKEQLRGAKAKADLAELILKEKQNSTVVDFIIIIYFGNNIFNIHSSRERLKYEFTISSPRSTELNNRDLDNHPNVDLETRVTFIKQYGLRMGSHTLRDREIDDLLHQYDSEDRLEDDDDSVIDPDFQPLLEGLEVFSDFEGDTAVDIDAIVEEFECTSFSHGKLCAVYNNGFSVSNKNEKWLFSNKVCMSTGQTRSFHGEPTCRYKKEKTCYNRRTK
ncbi:hypothetical protein HW555_013455 [Spodoptera exigua]|uniref:Regulatory protein zeste n=1 Tax=Spodoptera exigua TaxID=7107 RepID=A0A835L2I6_SPOEX|nr:hypothetical protein HW555_013455 [Spodoptera exigua]